MSGVRDGFRHDALFYEGPDEFTARGASFIRDGLAAGEPVLVVVVPEKIDLLRGALGPDADEVAFADMSEIGRNPSRIIPVWRDYIGRCGGAGRRVRGIGEPIWKGRSADELVESQRHETLLNVAFDGAPAWIRCPYDTAALPEDVIAEAFRSHPWVVNGHAPEPSPAFAGTSAIPAVFTHPLTPAPTLADAIEVGIERLRSVREAVAARARAFGLPARRAEDLVLAVSEVASNSVRHGGGHGILRMWADADTLVCEIEDAGRIEDPLAGRRAPTDGQEGGVGLWLVNQLCDLVQVRTFPTGSVVRLHMRRT